MKFSNLVKLCLVLPLLWCSLLANAINGIVSSSATDPTQEVEDLSVKVRGGYVRITREWNPYFLRWDFNKRWAPITRNSYLSLKRGNSNYEYTHFEAGKMVFEDRSGNQILANTWEELQRTNLPDVLWLGRDGSKVTYGRQFSIQEEFFTTKSYSDKNGVQITFDTNARRQIEKIRDEKGNVIISYEWVKNERDHTVLASITDYTGRTVKYSYEFPPATDDERIASVVDVLGGTWKYHYNDAGDLVSKEDPDGRIINQVSPGTAAGGGEPIYDLKTKLTHRTVYDSSGRVVETWENSIGEVVRKNINGELEFTAEFIVNDLSSNVDLISDFFHKSAHRSAASYLYTLESDYGANEKFCGFIGLISAGFNGLTAYDGQCVSSRTFGMQSQHCGNVCAPDGNYTRAADLDASHPLIRHDPDDADPAPYVKTKIVTDARGNKTTYEYDQWRNETKVTYPNGASVSRTWHSKYALPVTETNESGVVTAYEYDANGNLITKTEAQGLPEQRVTRYTYDQYGQLQTVTTGESTANNTALAKTSYEYDDKGNVTKITDPEGNVTTYSDFDVLGNARTIKDARSNLLPSASQYAWTATYDLAGNLLTSMDPFGKGEIFTYTLSGDVKTMTRADGSTATFTTNANGLPVTITDINGKTTKLEYDNASNLTAITDANNNKNQRTYDQQGRLLQLIDGENNTTRFIYEKNQLRAIQYPTFKQLYEYDNNDVVKQTVQQANSRNYLRKRGYNQQGDIASLTDSLENTITYEHDALDRIVKTINPTGSATEFTYDARDNLLQVKDPENRLTIYTYNKNNDLLTETKDGDQSTNRKRCYVYDANGNLISSINPDQEKTVYEYDQSNRLTRSYLFAQKNNSTAIKTVDYTYNDKDQLISWNQQPSNNLPNGVVATSDVIPTGEAYSYTTLGQMETVTVNFGAFSKSFSYTYYANGLKKTYTNPEGITYTYYYNKNNQLTAVYIPGIGQITYSDFKWLKPQTMQLPGGQKISYTYTDFLQTKDRVLKNSAQQVVGSAHYEYDLENNITKIAANDGDYNFTYDNLYRLKTTDVPDSNPANDEIFDYDGVSNRISHAVSGSANDSFAYNAKNQLANISSANPATFTYTNSGHTKTKTQNNIVTEYIYNHEERLIAVKIGGNLVAEYAYNPQGQRIKKTVNGKVTWYLYSENGLAAEYADNGTLLKEYQFHSQKTWMTDPLFMRTAAGDIYYYHNDHLGTPQQLVDSNGHVVWQAQYAAFGKANVSVSAVENNIRAPGQYYDEETGLHQNFNRDYDPELGRYIESDPIGLDGGINFYGYGYQNPLKYDDPTGEIIPLLVLYARCVGTCMAVDAAANALFPSPCYSAGKSAKDCAVECLNPLNLLSPVGGGGRATSKIVQSTSSAASKAAKGSGRAGRQSRLRELVNDDKVSSADRGWIRQEMNAINRGNRTSIRNPPGKQLAHERGREAAKGYDYSYTNLQDKDLHKLQHKYDNNGKKNIERPPKDQQNDNQTNLGPNEGSPLPKGGTGGAGGSGNNNGCDCG